MQTTITQISPVEYELEITATADEIAPQLDQALRKQQKHAAFRGFRPGHVPLPMLKKMFGETLAAEIVEREVQKAYENEVAGNEAYDLLGAPLMTALDYHLDGDLRAVIRFGVRPEVTLKDLSGESVDRLVLDVTDERIDEQIERLRQREADLAPVDEGTPITAEHYVVFDMQELDAATNTPLIGKRDEDQNLFLNDPQVDEHPMLSAFKKTALGKKAGDTFRFDVAHDEAHGGHTGGHRHVFQATIKEVKQFDLPEVDDAFAADVSDDQATTMEELRDLIRREIERSADRSTREFLENRLVERMLELHPVPVPRSAVEFFLDAFVDDVKQRNKNKLPENFDETAFREANRGVAEQQARWMLIRDAVVRQHSLEVGDDDMEVFFEREAQADDRVTAEQLRQFYKMMPKLMDSLRDRLLNEKVFETLAGQFTLVEKDVDDLEKELDEERKQAEAGAALRV